MSEIVFLWERTALSSWLLTTCVYVANCLLMGRLYGQAHALSDARFKSCAERTEGSGCSLASRWCSAPLPP